MICAAHPGAGTADTIAAGVIAGEDAIKAASTNTIANTIAADTIPAADTIKAANTTA